MDFYTIKTTVDIDNNAAFEAVLFSVGFFTQPLIVGDPHPEDNFFIFRFAVRLEGLRGFEEELVTNLTKTNFGFTVENTELIRAARI